MATDLPGLCVDYPNPDLWFAGGSARSGAIRKAIRICGNCPCRLACLEYVTETELSIPGAYGHRYGVAGGLTARQRKLARKAAA